MGEPKKQLKPASLSAAKRMGVLIGAAPLTRLDNNSYYQPIIQTNKNNSYKNGGSIHIAPSKRGTFTAAASKHGMSVQEFANKVLRNKQNYSPAMIKKANFARNVSKWN